MQGMCCTLRRCSSVTASLQPHLPLLHSATEMRAMLPEVQQMVSSASTSSDVQQLNQASAASWHHHLARVADHGGGVAVALCTAILLFLGHRTMLQEGCQDGLHLLEQALKWLMGAPAGESCF